MDTEKINIANIATHSIPIDVRIIVAIFKYEDT